MPASIALALAVLESLDWLAVSRRHVAVGEVAAVTDQLVEVRVTRMIKGEPPAFARFRGRLPQKTELLLFFDADRDVERWIDLSHPKGALRPDGNEYASRAEILEAVERRVGLDGPPPRKLLLHVGDQVIAVPADPEYLPQLLAETRDPDPWRRARAAWRLALYPGSDTTARLRALLSDKGHVDEGYPVRQAAFWALHALGINVPRPAGWTDALSESMLF